MKKQTIKSPTLVNAAETHKQHPKTFWVPPAKLIKTVKAGSFVKVSNNSERFWVAVTKRTENILEGVINNFLAANYDVPGNDGLRCGDQIQFHTDNIFDVLTPEQEKEAKALKIKNESENIVPVLKTDNKDKVITPKPILKKLVTHLEKYDFHPNFIDDDCMDICGMCDISLYDKEFAISFELGVPTMFVANLTKQVCDFAHKHNYAADIYEPYACVRNDDGICTDVLWGEEAFDFYENQ